MWTSYLGWFALPSSPFTKEIEAEDLWTPPSKRALVEGVCAAAEARASVLLVGEPGVGKTCVLRACRARLSEARYRLTYCHNATLGRRDFYRQLCVALGLAPSATAAALFYAVSTHVEQLAQERLHPVFLLDEAHLMQQDVLDHLHILLNYSYDSKALLSLVLIGLPELSDRLALRKNRSLSSRIEHRLVVGPLTVADTAEYVRYRLKKVDCERELFAEDAYGKMHEVSEGSMRLIGRVATGALREAARRKLKVATKACVETALLLQEPLPLE